MTCVIRSRSFAATLLLAALSSAVAPVRSLVAQSPTSPSGTTATLTPYRAPLIAMVQPPVATAGGSGSVPQDKPVVVFRFAAGEADDPLDVGSFVVAVDGADRTPLFQTTASQAWGPLTDADAIRRGAFAAGPHRVVARICSNRGACALTDAQVMVAPTPGLAQPMADTATTPEDKTTRTPLVRRALGMVLDAARKLLQP